MIHKLQYKNNIKYNNKNMKQSVKKYIEVKF